MLDVTSYTYKKKAGLVGCYLHVLKKELDLLDVIYMYKEKSWTCWMLSTCTKKKARLVGCYLHVQRKKLDLLDVIYMYKEKSWTCWMFSILQRKKLNLFRYVM